MAGTAEGDVFTDVADVTFVASDDGVEILDPVERHRVLLEADVDDAPRAVSTDDFSMPLDAAATFRADSVTLPVVAVYVRTSEGELVTQVEHFAYEDLPDGSYVLEFAAHVKVYVSVEGPLTLRSDVERIHLEFPEETTVRVGARSLHDSPADTITTTDRPRDVMRAVTAFGHALKTTSPERSYPTLRGHPPLLERGDSLRIPPLVDPPESRVRVEIPPTLEYVYPAAPLTYYLQAALEPGRRPRIVTDDGYEYALDGPGGFADTVERVLKRVFLLDCVTRTEGYYDITLHERERLGAELDLDFPALYDASETDRLAAFLEVSYEDVAEYVPTWKTEAQVVPRPGNLELLPFFVDELAVVKSPNTHSASPTDTQSEAVRDFLRSNGSTDSGAADPYIKPGESDAIEQVWAGDGAPIGATKAVLDGYLNRLDRQPVEGNIKITVVVNASEMLAESDLLDDVYGAREELPFDIQRYEELDTGELREVLAEDADFLHYIGHIDEEGFECEDGKLDSATVTETGVDAFLLNACSSYEVGMDLIHAGAIGGIVTLSDVLNNAAVTMGSNLAKLLNNGFPLASALDVARDETYAGGQYTIVGDGGMNVAQPMTGIPDLCEIVEEHEDSYDIQYWTYPTSETGMGIDIIPLLRDTETYYLSTEQAGTFEVSRENLRDFFTYKKPVLSDGELTWSDEFCV